MNIYIRGIQLPFRVKGVTVQDADGNFNIYVNTQLDNFSQKKAYNHELKHIKLEHFQDFNPVIQNELEASC